jgi:hypothetical protein
MNIISTDQTSMYLIHFHSLLIFLDLSGEYYKSKLKIMLKKQVIVVDYYE